MLVLPHTWRVSRILSLRHGFAVTNDVNAVLSETTELSRASELWLCSGSHRPQSPTPPFGPSTPTQQTGRLNIRTGRNIVSCQQPDVRKPRHAVSLKCLQPLAKADHFMACPSYKWVFYFALRFSIKYINNCYRHLINFCARCVAHNVFRPLVYLAALFKQNVECDVDKCVRGIIQKGRWRKNRSLFQQTVPAFAWRNGRNPRAARCKPENVWTRSKMAI
jgi:hypothetical protein